MTEEYFASNTLDTFLEKYGLADRKQAFIDQGMSELRDLLEITDGDCEDFIKTLSNSGLLFGERSRLRRGLRVEKEASGVKKLSPDDLPVPVSEEELNELVRLRNVINNMKRLLENVEDLQSQFSQVKTDATNSVHSYFNGLIDFLRREEQKYVNEIAAMRWDEIDSLHQTLTVGLSQCLDTRVAARKLLDEMTDLERLAERKERMFSTVRIVADYEVLVRKNRILWGVPAIHAEQLLNFHRAEAADDARTCEVRMETYERKAPPEWDERETTQWNPRGTVKLTVKCANALEGMDRSGLSDPYVLVYLNGKNTRVQSQVIKQDVNPVWNEELVVKVKDAPNDVLQIRVYDWDRFSKHDKIGHLDASVREILDNVGRIPVEERRLEGSNGTLTLGFEYMED